MSSPAEREQRCVICHATYPAGIRFCSIDGGAIVDVDAAPDEHVGKTIGGRYLVRRFLGRGGMGSVYEADHLGLDKRVAIKFLLEPDADARARFRREARAASKVVHQHVIHLYDVGTDGNLDYIVMEFLEGRDLRKVLAAGALGPERAVAIARKMLLGLHAIHQAGIIHRDIKPANVLLTTVESDSDFVKIMDFGISKSLAATATAALTDTGRVIGTPQYMAPEQLLGQELDGRADLYAVGLTLFEMIAGASPFEAASSAQFAAKHISSEAPSLDAVCPDLPAAVGVAVARALAKSPANRFDDALAFAAALDDPHARRFDAPTVSSRPDRATTEPSPRMRRRWWPVALVVAILAAGAIAFAVTREGDKPNVVAPSVAPDASVSQHLAYARDAIRAGNLELAIEAYKAAYASDRDATSLYEIAVLHARLDRKREAATYYRRYLEAVPQASDRDRIAAEIARLDPAAPTPDAAVAKPATRVPPVAKKTGLYCRCSDATTALCATKSAPRCRCQVASGVLCPTPLAPGNVCSDPNSMKFVTPGRSGDQCSGYLLYTPSDQRLIGGALRCSVCADASRLEYRGQDGDPCVGYAVDGTRVAGQLGPCSTAPQPGG